MSDSQNVHSLPLGVSSFITIRKSGSIYIDKTGLIYQMASRAGAKIFLARPRRFGKSLLISTLETLFRDGLRWFKGLAIEKLWHDKQYKVLTLDFSDTKDFRTFDVFLKKFRAMLNESFQACHFNFTIPVEQDPINGFGEFILCNEELVLLIDEYDAPFTSNLDNHELFESVREYLSGFYAKIKSKDHFFRFIFMTGILKFNHTEIFSSFNNLDDISLIPDYGDLLGYTDKEITFYFDSYLIRAANINAKTKDEILNDMKEQYDGFCFDRLCSTHVYAPWSVLKFLLYPKMGLLNYWFSTGGNPVILMNNLEKIQIFIEIYNKKEQIIPVSMLELSNNPANLDNKIILFYSGYLTIKEVFKSQNEYFAKLYFPNLEVENSFPRLLLETITSLDNTPLIYQAIKKAFIEDNINEIFKILNSIFISMHYSFYPIKNEAICRAMLQIFMKGLGFSLIVEKGNTFGRSDIEVLCDHSLWVFEMKYLKGKATPFKIKSLLQKAVEQMQTHRYGEGEGDVKKIRRLALVFSEDERSLVGCKLDRSMLTQS